MKANLKIAAVLIALCVAPAVRAQVQFQVDGRSVQIHGFAAQGFAYSNDNNFLTMKTSDGSFAFTDGGFNVSSSLSDKFRVGAQAYTRNLGDLGKGHVSIDWAFGDYKFKDWFGIRAGKVKTALGLFNDTQDMEFLHTWAILPQSVYPLDLRANIISHTGGDVYGEFDLKHYGSLMYTGYFGARTNDTRGGYYKTLADADATVKSFGGVSGGGDVHWNTPLQGLMTGVSWMKETLDLKGSIPAAGGPITIYTDPQHITAAYADFARGKWHFDGEFRRNYERLVIGTLYGPSISFASEKSWFTSAAYRVSKHLELGTYHSRYYVDNPKNPLDKNSNHIFDQTVTARIDLSKYWNVKIEEHFMDGYGDPYSSHGFYPDSNPSGLKPKTDMFVVRTGVNF